jgi:D-alanyl-lipoteichoic acid acyltransferase DltB (MBOAT superfamily)
MTKCMSNNYSAVGFWRSWHKSYNVWLVRYVYIPLGGNKNRIFNTLIAFTFVAVWHDIELKLLVWGWLITLFILPEVIVGSLFRKYVISFILTQFAKSPFYLFLAACGASLNIIMMVIANLVGFCFGLNGLQQVLKIFSLESMNFYLILQIFGFYLICSLL